MSALQSKDTIEISSSRFVLSHSKFIISNFFADNVMRIATEILGVKGLKAHNNWSQQRLYTEWLQISMVLIFIWDDLTSYWFRNFKNRFVPSQPHTSYFKDASNKIELRCGTANPMICVLQFFKAQVYRSNFESFCQKFCNIQSSIPRFATQFSSHMRISNTLHYHVVSSSRRSLFY